MIISSEVRITGWNAVAARDLDTPAPPADVRRTDRSDWPMLALLVVIELAWVTAVIWFAARSL